MSENDNTTEEQGPSRGDERIVRLIKSISINPLKGEQFDERIIKYKYYNSFNYSQLARDPGNSPLSFGIISAQPGEGKTVVAANLAVSLALGWRKKTLILDLNIAHPSLHRVFGTALSPGLAESLNNGTIHVSDTAIEHLSVLSTGQFFGQPVDVGRAAPFSELATGARQKPTLGLSQLAPFRDVIYSLEQVYDFIIVDMPAMNLNEVPTLFALQLNGLIIVVDSGKTKQEEIDSIFRQINPNHVIGFVFNHFDE
jgi:Mrp family chromosome partitioning ATPase